MRGPNAGVELWLLLWMVIGLVIVLFQWRRTGVGLVPAYVINLWFIHWVGAAVYMSDLPHLYEEHIIARGLQESGWALGAFAIGVLLLGPLISSRRPARSEASERITPRRIFRIYLITGVLSYVGMSLFFGDVPTLQAFVYAGTQLVLVALALYIYRAFSKQAYLPATGWIALSLLLPLITIVVDGFLSFGIASTLAILTFVGAVARKRLRTIVLAVLACFLGLSFFVTYMEHRSDIRAVVWSGAPMNQRLDELSATFSAAEWFTPGKQEHLDAIDVRLNQNYYVGLAIQRLGVSQEYARGSTVVESVLALVPRAIWTDKPIFAGSTNLVSQYTGIRFNTFTSVGVGQVLELYINFGRAGVLLGFALLGTALSILDVRAAEALRTGNWSKFVILFVVGLSIVQVEGSLVNISGGAGASFLLALLVNKIILHGSVEPPELMPSVDSPVVHA